MVTLITHQKLESFTVERASAELVCGGMKFYLFGPETIAKFQKFFRVGDVVHILSEGGIIQRLSKGVDMEV
jgi:hypothetical protein